MHRPIPEILTRLTKILLLISLLLLTVLLSLVYINSRPYTFSKAPENNINSVVSLSPPSQLTSFEPYKNLLLNCKTFKPPLYTEIVSTQHNDQNKLQLLGITGSDPNRRALIYNPQNDSMALYSTGQYINDIKVQEIYENNVTLSHGDQIIKLNR